MRINAGLTMPTARLQITQTWQQVADGACVIQNKSQNGTSIYIMKQVDVPSGGTENALEIRHINGDWSNSISDGESIYARTADTLTGEIVVMS